MSHSHAPGDLYTGSAGIEKSRIQVCGEEGSNIKAQGDKGTEKKSI
jgi:hypothetical protein